MLRVKSPKNTRHLAKWSYLTTEPISTVGKVPAYYTERPPRTTKHADNTRTGGPRRVRPPRAPTDRLRRYGLRPSTGGAQYRAGAHGRLAAAMPRPRSRARPGALGSPRQGHGARVARGRVLSPGAGSGGPEHTMTAAQLALPPANCSGTQQQHGRLARSEVARRRHSAQATQSNRRPSCTCCGSRCKLRTAAAGAVRMGRRGGQGLRGHGGLGRLAVCTFWLMPMQASRNQHRSDLARPLRLAANAAMLAS